MFSTVRKSISYTLIVARFLAPGAALNVAWCICSQQPTLAQKVKKLDDNAEVLRPIPAVLKPATPASPAPQAKAATPQVKDATLPNKDAGKKTVSDKTETKKTATDKKAEPDKKAETEKRAEPDKKAETDKKSDSGKAKKVSHGGSLGAHFVPPPPPITPSMMGDSADYALYGSMPLEMMGREALKDRAKEIGIQYKDAAQELADRSREKDEKIARAKEFEGLFQEGVVSKRELEASKREAGTVNSDIDRLTIKTNDLKSLLDRINKRLASKTAAIAAAKPAGKATKKQSRRIIKKPEVKSEAKPETK